MDYFCSPLVFSDDGTFNSSAQVKRYKMRKWELQNLTESSSLQNLTELPSLLNVKFFCVMPALKIYGLFIFVKKTVTCKTCLDILHIWLFLLIKYDRILILFSRRRGTNPLGYRGSSFLNTDLPHKWIGHSRQDDLLFHSWPHTSPDMIPYDFYL